MWQQNYTPIGGNLLASAFVAALPIFTILILLGVLRRPAWLAAVSAVIVALLVALLAYQMPPSLAVSATLFGAAFGLFPIWWVVFAAIFLFRIVEETGRFEVIKNSVVQLTNDQRLQLLLIGFTFGAFMEGAAGFGAPVAVAAAMLAGLGFARFEGAALCLIANTSPVAFGSIGIPIVTLAATTQLGVLSLSANAGRLCAPISLILPCYLMLTLGGPKALRGVLPAAALCGVVYAVVQFLVSNYMGPWLTDILGSMLSLIALLILLRLWQPQDSDQYRLAGENADTGQPVAKLSAAQVLLAWLPYLLLVVIVILWGIPSIHDWLELATVKVPWPGLHNLIQRMPPVVTKATNYAATYNINYLSAAGSAVFLAALLSAICLKVSPGKCVIILGKTLRQLGVPAVTFASVLALALLMNYSGATATLGLAFAATGSLFPVFSVLLGWIGVFLTGSDTSSNALFGNLQVITANSLHLNPTLMAAANSAGGVMGKMISLQSLAVAVAATGMKTTDEPRLFRKVIGHSVLLVALVAILNVIYSALTKA
ncbi:MAG: lactate permease LctP family transporter [Verrucomicrobia bacterium]|nr:lactate permease LctP family transporter [Verrucomicrobiota bacterium]MBV8277748.1 lactate permease LctP family transporter [Verrucomicrobiota bacterium]